MSIGILLVRFEACFDVVVVGEPTIDISRCYKDTDKNKLHYSCVEKLRKYDGCDL